MYIAPTLELKTSSLAGCPHNNQSSKLDQEGGNGPKEFWCLSSNFVPGVQFPRNFSGLSSCLVGWVASCVVLYNPPPAVVPAWLESQVWTLGPNSNTWFLSDIFRPLFHLFSATFASCGWSGFLELLVVRWWRRWRTGWSGWRRRRGGTQSWTKYSRFWKCHSVWSWRFDLRKKTERTEAWMEQSPGMSWRRFMKCMRWGNLLKLIKFN